MAYASSLEQDDDDEPELLCDDEELAKVIAKAAIVHVPAKDFFERLDDFSGAIVWVAVDVDELITYAAARDVVVKGFRATDFPGFEVQGSFVAARVYECT